MKPPKSVKDLQSYFWIAVGFLFIAALVRSPEESKHFIDAFGSLMATVLPEMVDIVVSVFEL